MSSREEFEKWARSPMDDDEEELTDLERGWNGAWRARDAEIAALRAQVEEARRFGEMAAEQHNELLRRTITCAFCGAAYPDETPASGAEVLTKHIATCERHPMRAVEAERDEARAQAAGMREAAARIADSHDHGHNHSTCTLIAKAIRALPPTWEPDIPRASGHAERDLASGLNLGDAGSPAQVAATPGQPGAGPPTCPTCGTTREEWNRIKDEPIPVENVYERGRLVGMRIEKAPCLDRWHADERAEPHRWTEEALAEAMWKLWLDYYRPGRCLGPDKWPDTCLEPRIWRKLAHLAICGPGEE